MWYSIFSTRIHICVKTRSRRETISIMPHKKITFIHTADIHFGMENYGRIDPYTGIHSRLADFAKALHFCVDVAIEKQVDFFLFSGDAYKTHHPSQTQQKLLMECFFRLYKEKIPIIIVVGNHDHPLTFGKANALDLFGQLPLDGFYVIAKPEIITLQTKNGPVQIVGIPWPTRNTIALSAKHIKMTSQDISEYITQAVTSIVANLAQKLDPTLPSVLAAHLTVASGIFSGSEKRAIYGSDPIFLPSQLAIFPFDYVALGHLHRHQQLNPAGTPPIVYSGSIERIDFGERKEEKGFCLVSIENKRAEFEFIPGPMRSFVQIDVALHSDMSQTDQIITAIERHSIDDAVVKIVYQLPVGQCDQVDLRKVQFACRSAIDIAGIIPIGHTPARSQRIQGACVNMDLESLLHLYFDNKPEYKDREDDLVKKTLQLWDTITQQQIDLNQSGEG